MPYMFINETSITYAVMEGINQTTGGWFLTLLIIMIFLFLLATVARIPVELTGIILLPLCLVIWAEFGQFMAVSGVLLIFLGVILAKNLPTY